MASNEPAKKARQKLLEIERTRQRVVISEFEKIQVRLAAELDDVLKAIEIERRQTGNASPALIFRQFRLDSLINQISEAIAEASTRLAALTTSAQVQAIQTARTQSAGYPTLAGDLTVFDEQSTRELISIAGDGQPLAKHFADLAKPARVAMFDALFFGIATGSSNAQIAREVRDAINGTTARAMTIVRTETNQAYRESTRKFYDDTPGVVGWRWLSARDLRTCPVCWAMDGRIFKTKTKFGTHPNCRCTMVPVFKDEAKQETGAEAFAKLNEAQKLAILGPKRLELYNRGAELIDFVALNKSAFGIGRHTKPIRRITFVPNPRTPVPVNPNPPAAPTPKKTSIDRTTPKPAPSSTAVITGPPPKFESVGEASHYFETRYPGKAFDFDGVALSLVNSNAPELTSLLDEYPAVTERLAYIGTYRDKSKIPRSAFRRSGRYFSRAEFAHAATSGEYIAFNPKWYSDPAKYLATKKRSRAVGWTVTDADAGTASHEFGHQIDHWIRRTGGTIGEAAFADGRNEATSILDRMIKELAPKKTRKGSTPDLSRGVISDYALTDKSELMAESFSMIRHRPEKDWPPFVKALNRFLERVKKGVTPNSEVVKEFRNLDDAAKEVARKEFRDFLESLGLKVKEND